MSLIENTEHGDEIVTTKKESHDKKCKKKQHGNIAAGIKYRRTPGNRKRGGFRHRLLECNYFSSHYQFLIYRTIK
jgi:hypothetical protein